MNLTRKLTKRFVAVIAALVLAFTVAACDGFESPLDDVLNNVAIVYSQGDSNVAVTQDVSLPTVFGDATISWTSSNQNVITNGGEVTRGFSDVTVTLTARVDLNGEVATVSFTVTVLGYDADAMLDDIALSGTNISYDDTLELFMVTGDFTIPQAIDGFAISWSSTAPSIVSTDGVVNIPAYGEPDAIVTLTASINGVELDFELVVKASTVAPDPDMVRLEEAKVLLLISGVSDGVLVDVDLPMYVGAEGSADRVSVTWSSSNPSVLADDGTVTRPAPGSGNVTVTMTATLTLNGKSVTKDFDLIVIEEVSATPTDSIADAIAKSIDADGNVQEFYAFIPGVTILGITNDGVVIMDETGILFMYGADGDDLAIGEVYDVQGVTDNYFGGWQLGSANGQPIIFIPSSEAATPFNPTVSASVTEILANTHIPDATDKFFTYAYYEVTAKVVVTDESNRYGTFLVDTTYAGDGSDITVDPNSAQELDAWLIYYQSNYQELHAFNGLEVTLEVLMYSYRTDRTIFTALFFGTADDVSVDLTDAETLDLVDSVIDGNVDGEYIADTTLTLPTALFGATIAYTSDSDLLDPATGALTMPTEGQVTITLTATITKGAETKVVDYVIYAGESAAISIADALAEASGTLVTVQGFITLNVDNSNFFISDGTGALDIYVGSSASDEKTALLAALADGTAVEIIATRGAYNGLEQISSIQSIRTISAPEFSFPQVVDASGMAEADLATYAAQLVRLVNLEVVSTAYDSYGNLDISLTDGTNTYTVRWDSRTVTPEGYPTTLVAGDLVEVVAGVYYNNSVRLRIDSADDVIPYVPSLSIGDALLETSGTVVKVQGYITMNIDNANFLISDGTGALDIYVGSSDSDVKTALLAALADGTAVEVVAARGAYNGLEQLGSVESVNVVANPEFAFPEATDVTAMTLADLENYKAELVFFSGLEVVSIAYDSYGNLDITALNAAAETVVIRWDSRTATPEGYPTTLVAGDLIDVTAGVSWSNSLRLRIDSANDVEIHVPLMTIADALLEASGTLVKVQGFITLNVDNSNFFITDGTGALDIYVGSSDSPEKTALLAALADGTAVEIIAGRGAYNGLEQISGIEKIETVDNPSFVMPDPMSVAFADLENYKAQLVRFENLEVVALSYDSYGNLDIEATDGTDTYMIRWDSRTMTPEGYPTTLVAGDKINVVAGVYYSNSVRLRIDSADDVSPYVALMSIADALLEGSGTLVRVQGYITTNVDNANFLLQDDTGALDIYLGSSSSPAKDAVLAALENGTAIELTATRGAYNGLEQISGVSVFTMISSPSFAPILPLDVSAMAFADLENYKAQLVSFTNLEVVSISYDSYGNLDLEVTDGTDTFFVRWDSRTGAPEGYPTTLVAGNTINVVAGVYYSNSVRLRIDSAEDVTRYLTEADKVEEDKQALDLPTAIPVDDTLTLPAAGAYGSTVTWASDNAAIDASTGAVTVATGGSVVVTLTATITLGSTTDTRDFVITVGLDISTVAAVRAADYGTQMAVQVVITDLAVDSNGNVVAFAQDDSAGIYLYKIPAAMAANLQVGDLVEITGDRAEYRSLVQMNNFERFVILSTGNNVAPAVLTDPSTAEAAQGSFVQISGYLREAYTGTPSDYFLVTASGTFQLRLVSGSDQDATERDAIIAKLVGAAEGSMVTVQAGIGQYNTTVQFMLLNAANIAVGPVGSEANLLEVAVGLTTLPAEGADVISNLTLPTTALFGTTIAWTTDNAAVLATDGTVTRPTDADAAVALGYTFTLGAETATGTINVNVPMVTLASDLFISEYIEGSSNNKAIEIFNGTGSDVNLADYRIILMSNGASDLTAPSQILTFTTEVLVNGDVFVAYNSQSVADIVNVGDVSSTITYFNGDDTVILQKTTDGGSTWESIDIIGVLGEDPWTLNGATVAWVNHTYVRNSDITGPSATWDPAEWTEYGEDDFSYLGVHSME